MHSKVDLLNVKLDIATDERVPPLNDKCTELFAIYSKPVPVPDNNGYTMYRMVRRQKRTFTVGADRCRKDGYTKEIYCSDSPNAVNLGGRFKDVLPKEYGRVNGCTIRLVRGKTAQDLIEFIRRVEAEKKQV